MKSVAWPAERIPSGRAKRIANKRLVEAGGVEPASGQNTNWLKAGDFRRNLLEIRCLLGNSLCSGVLSSALECSPVMEIFWRRSCQPCSCTVMGSGRPAGAQVDEAVRLYEQGWSLRAVGQHIGRSLKEVPAAVSNQGRSIRSKGEQPPTRGAPQLQENPRCSTSFP